MDMQILVLLSLGWFSFRFGQMLWFLSCHFWWLFWENSSSIYTGSCKAQYVILTWSRNFKNARKTSSEKVNFKIKYLFMLFTRSFVREIYKFDISGS